MSQPWDNSSPAHSEELLFPAPCYHSLWSHVPKPAAPSPPAFLEWPCLPRLCKCWSSLAGWPLVLHNGTVSLGRNEIRKRKMFDVNTRGNLQGLSYRDPRTASSCRFTNKAALILSVLFILLGKILFEPRWVAETDSKSLYSWQPILQLISRCRGHYWLSTQHLFPLFNPLTEFWFLFRDSLILNSKGGPNWLMETSFPCKQWFQEWAGDPTLASESRDLPPRALLENADSLLRETAKTWWSLFFLWMSLKARCLVWLLPSWYQPDGA